MGSSSKSEKKEKSKKKKDKERKSKDKPSESGKEKSQQSSSSYRPISDVADHALLESYFQNGSLTFERFKEMTADLGLSAPDIKIKSLQETSNMNVNVNSRQESKDDSEFVRTILEKQKSGAIDMETCIKLMNMLSNSDAPEQKVAHTQYAPPRTERYFNYPFQKTVVPPNFTGELGHSSFDDTDTAMLRRDYVNLKSLLESAFAARIEQEISCIKKITEVKKGINAKLKEIEEESAEIVKSSVVRTKALADEQFKEINELKSAHEQVLKRISTFMKIVSGPKPRDALSMELYGSTPESCVGGIETGNENGIELDDYYRQFVKSQMALKDQQVHPHPLVMRDFVVRFEELKLTAHKVASAPVVGLGSKYQNCSFEEALEKMSTQKPLESEVKKWKEQAEAYSRQRSELEQKQRVIYSMVAEREEYENEKLEILGEIQRLSEESTKEVSSWVRLHETTTKNLTTQIAKLQEENRLLKLRLQSTND